MTEKNTGRPPKPEHKKRKTRSFRFTDSEYENLQQKAQKAGMEKTEYIVKSLNL